MHNAMQDHPTIRHVLFRWAVMLVALLCFTPRAHAQPQQLIVFAASSLTDAFTDIEAAFELERPDIDVVFNFAGSSTLVAQLTNGAPADVFASADANQMRIAHENELVQGFARIFAYNRLALIAPISNPASISRILDLAQPDVQLILAAQGVPVRAYTDQLFQAYTASYLLDAEFLNAVYANVISEEDNVRQVAAKIALNEADAGIVYQSDITPAIAGEVTVLSIDDALNPRAAYPIARLTQSDQPENAAAFIAYIRSEIAQRNLEAWGFIPFRPR
jgi:molybdate transport system substrate-binding protein